MTDSNDGPPTAVVTGGNSGIGAAVAEALGAKRYRVWIAGRNAEKGAALVEHLRPRCPAGIEFLRIDMTLFAEIEQFVCKLKPQLGGRLDALVHSTGVVNTRRVVSADDLEEGWATQFLGRYLLTEALTPELSSVDDGRVVFVSARAPKTPKLFEDDPSLESNFTTFRAVAQNQSACALYEQTYAAEHPNGPAINGAVAGLVKDTGIGRAQPNLVKAMNRAVLSIVGITPEQSARNVVALASDPVLRGVSGYYFSKPQNLEKRRKLAYDEAHVEQLRRLLARYADIRSGLLSA